jgi:hypothetical protein
VPGFKEPRHARVAVQVVLYDIKASVGYAEALIQPTGTVCQRDRELGARRGCPDAVIMHVWGLPIAHVGGPGAVALWVYVEVVYFPTQVAESLVQGPSPATEDERPHLSYAHEKWVEPCGVDL